MRRIILTAGILICLLAFMPSVSASSDSARMLLFVGNSEEGLTYDVGDNVPVEVRFFDSGQPKDADSNPTVTLNSYDSNSREISVSRTGLGIYTGSFTINEGDVNEYTYIGISADATLGKENAADNQYDEDSEYQGLFVAGEVGLDAELVFDKSKSSFMMAKPGDTVHMTITITDNGVNVDPDSLDVTADDKPLTHTRTGTGMYKASYTISSSVVESQRIDIDVEAEYNDEWDWASGTIIMDFYPIWYHEITITGSYAEFELCAADMEGSALSGAAIDFTYEIDDYVDEDSSSQSGATDSNGRAQFTLSHSSGSEIYIEGTVQYSGRTQHFQGRILLSSQSTGSQIEEPRDWDDFEVIYQQNAGSLNSGQTVTLEYIAYEYAIPVSNQPIYYYLHTNWDFIKSGSTTCDGNGRFTITFTVPESSGTIYVEFESPFEKEDSRDHGDCDDNLVYRESYDYIYVSSTTNIFTDRDTSISIGTDSFEIGSTATITASRPNSNGFLAAAVVLVGELKIEEIDEDYRTEWEAWVGLSLSLLYPLTVENNRITHDIVLPEFLPEDETYTVLVLFVNPQALGLDYHWNYMHVKPAASQEEEEGDLRDVLFSSPLRLFGIGIPCLLILLIIIIILVVLVAASRPRKEERRTPARNVVTVEPEPVAASPRPSGQSYAAQRDYYGGYYRPPARTASKVPAPKTYPSQYAQRYPVSEAAYRDEMRRNLRSSAPTFQSEKAPTRQGYEPLEKRFQKPSSVTVRCQGCNNVFYIQDKTPPFKTKCPFCARHNIVV
jgi:hypothetical protein